MSELPTCGLIGLGRLGRTLALAFHRRGCLRFVKGRSHEHAHWAHTHALPYADRWEELPPVELLWLTVPDHQIATVVAECIHALGLQFLRQTSLVHTAGSLGGEPFQPWAGELRWGCAHPFQTFPLPPQPQLLRCIGWLIESPHAQTQQQLATVVRALDGIPIVLAHIDAQRRALYHAAAVVASNALVAILLLARQLARRANIPDALFLQPIASTALSNVFASPGPPPLTGPIVRGDWDTLQRHLQALSPAEAEAYGHLLAAIGSIARQHNLLLPEHYSRLLELLNRFPTNTEG